MSPKSPSRKHQSIPDIHIGRVYDQNDPDADIHYETFERLADFFGRNTPPHRHYGFYQVHFLTHGSINIHLDDYFYIGDAPLVIVTPPTIPHTFYTDEGTTGHVVTMRQEVVREWYAAMPGQWPDTLLREHAFLPLGDSIGSVDYRNMLVAAELLQQEFARHEKGRSASLLALAKFFFINLTRLLVSSQPSLPVKRERSEDLRIFLAFCDLVEACFRDHITLSEYAKRLGITESRLNDVSRRIAGKASKELVHERLLQEARRLLRFSAVPVSEIGYQLGYDDPAYFSRFFTRNIGMPPSEFRTRHHSSDAEK
ncbi:MAG TPA: 4-hydroxyphenylacetate catabolism regulatory protein HpaA [Rhodocyclaceae bacterium]|nr:4-hydroxyphenylacetate catabolism regulatory protein HpaA [Rhodocyclaceae bacterium]